MINIVKTILIIWSIILIYKAIAENDTEIAYDHLYDGTLIGLLGILIKPII